MLHRNIRRYRRIFIDFWTAAITLIDAMIATYAVIVAAGRGTRFGGTLPKQYLPLGNGTVLRHAIAAFATHPRVAGVQVVIRDEDRAIFDEALSGLAVLPPVPGGAERQDLVRLGLEALAAHDPARVLIHDGARPFPDAGADRPGARRARPAPAAIPALPLGDTIKRVEDGVIRETVDRSHLWRAQTPQGFHFAPILAAHRAAAGRVLTDDAAVAEAAGIAPVDSRRQRGQSEGDDRARPCRRRAAAR